MRFHLSAVLEQANVSVVSGITTVVTGLGVGRNDWCVWEAASGLYLIWKVITQVKTVTHLYKCIQPHT